MRPPLPAARFLTGALLALGLGFLLELVTPSDGQALQMRTIYETDSLYHHLLVMEDAQGLRYLSFNRAMGHQSVVKPGHPEHLTFAYTKSGFAALAFLDRPPAKALFVGLGGGSMPMYLRLVEPRVAIDIAEIDPEVTRVAEKYLGFRPDPAMKVFPQDGRLFLKRNPQRYDLIFAANGNRTMADYERALTPTGIFVMAGGTTSQMFDAILFGRFKTKKGGKTMKIFLASSSPADLAIIKDLIEAGKVKPMMDRCYPLEQTAEAMRYLEAGHAKGKIVVCVGEGGL